MIVELTYNGRPLVLQTDRIAAIYTNPNRTETFISFGGSEDAFCADGTLEEVCAKVGFSITRKDQNDRD